MVDREQARTQLEAHGVNTPPFESLLRGSIPPRAALALSGGPTRASGTSWGRIGGSPPPEMAAVISRSALCVSAAAGFPRGSWLTPQENEFERSAIRGPRS